MKIDESYFTIEFDFPYITNWLPSFGSQDLLLEVDKMEEGGGGEGGSLSEAPQDVLHRIASTSSGGQESSPSGASFLGSDPSSALPLMLSPSSAVSMSCDSDLSGAPVLDSSQSAMLDSLSKLSRMSWSGSGAPRRRMSLDECTLGGTFDSNNGKSFPMGNPLQMFGPGVRNMRQGVERQSGTYRKLVCPYPLCGYITDRESWLKTHVRKHTGERPFSCPHCPYRSAQKSNLTVHIRKVHEKEKDQSRAGGFNAAAGDLLGRVNHQNSWPSSSSVNDAQNVANLLQFSSKNILNDGALVDKTSF